MAENYYHLRRLSQEIMERTDPAKAVAIVSTLGQESPEQVIAKVQELADGLRARYTTQIKQLSTSKAAQFKESKMMFSMRVRSLIHEYTAPLIAATEAGHVNTTTGVTLGLIFAELAAMRQMARFALEKMQDQDN